MAASDHAHDFEALDRGVSGFHRLEGTDQPFERWDPWARSLLRLKKEAKAALEAGKLEQADALLERVLAAQDAAAERQQLEAAATSAQRGNIALTRLRYRDAAAHFAAAARRVPREHEEQALAYLDQEAAAFYRQGDEFGDNPALVDAIDRCRALLKHRPRARVALDWASTQTALGLALATLGEREGGTARLEEAVAAYGGALDVFAAAQAVSNVSLVRDILERVRALLAQRRGSPGGEPDNPK